MAENLNVLHNLCENKFVHTALIFLSAHCTRISTAQSLFNNRISYSVLTIDVTVYQCESSDNGCFTEKSSIGPGAETHKWLEAELRLQHTSTTRLYTVNDQSAKWLVTVCCGKVNDLVV